MADYNGLASGADIDKIAGLNSTAGQIDNMVSNGATQADLDALALGSGNLTESQAETISNLSGMSSTGAEIDRNSLISDSLFTFDISINEKPYGHPVYSSGAFIIDKSFDVATILDSIDIGCITLNHTVNYFDLIVSVVDSSFKVLSTKTIRYDNIVYGYQYLKAKDLGLIVPIGARICVYASRLTKIGSGAGQGRRSLPDIFDISNTTFSNDSILTVSNTVTKSSRDIEMIFKTETPKLKSINNYLENKIIGVIGDSMVEGFGVSVDETCFYKIADRNKMTYFNYGLNGCNLSYNGYWSMYDRMMVATNNNVTTEEYDYFLFYGGTNDLLHTVTIGDINSTTPTELCGALNLMINNARSRFPKAKLGVITPYKIVNANALNYINAIIAVCNNKKVPVFNNSINSGIDFLDSNIVSTLTKNDGLHLSYDGHEFVSYTYENFIRSL